MINRYLALAATIMTLTPAICSAESAVDRGKYLVTVGSCADCHTPGTFLGKPDSSRYLGGSTSASTCRVLASSSAAT